MIQSATLPTISGVIVVNLPSIKLIPMALAFTMLTQSFLLASVFPYAGFLAMHLIPSAVLLAHQLIGALWAVQGHEDRGAVQHVACLFHPVHVGNKQGRLTWSTLRLTSVIYSLVHAFAAVTVSTIYCNLPMLLFHFAIGIE